MKISLCFCFFFWRLTDREPLVSRTWKMTCRKGKNFKEVYIVQGYISRKDETEEWAFAQLTGHHSKGSAGMTLTAVWQGGPSRRGPVLGVPIPPSSLHLAWCPEQESLQTTSRGCPCPLASSQLPLMGGKRVEVRRRD